MARRNSNTGKKFAAGALVAGVAGYLTGILTAPKSGKETREDIMDKASDAKSGAEEQLNKAQEELDELMGRAKSKTLALSSQAREELNEAVIKAKDAQNKATSVLKAVRAGEADDPELNKAVKQLKQAQKNLSKYFKG